MGCGKSRSSRITPLEDTAVGQLAIKLRNVAVRSTCSYKRKAPGVDGAPGIARMVICALNYAETEYPLTCEHDSRNMKEFAEACGVSDVTVLFEEQCSPEAVTQAIQTVGKRCSEDDVFIFYFAGHGVSVEEVDGDEADGQDEAFVLLGAGAQAEFLKDDDFANVIVDSLPVKTRVLILTDCCHSGTIADLERPIWGRREVVAVSGCLDSQESGDVGCGGVFTHALLLAVQKATKLSKGDCSVGRIFNCALEQDIVMANDQQSLCISACAGFSPHRMAWPLVPSSGYCAPLWKPIQQTFIGFLTSERGLPAGATLGVTAAALASKLREAAQAAPTEPDVLLGKMD